MNSNSDQNTKIYRYCMLFTWMHGQKRREKPELRWQRVAAGPFVQPKHLKHTQKSIKLIAIENLSSKRTEDHQLVNSPRDNTSPKMVNRLHRRDQESTSCLLPQPYHRVLLLVYAWRCSWGLFQALCCAPRYGIPTHHLHSNHQHIPLLLRIGDENIVSQLKIRWDEFDWYLMVGNVAKKLHFVFRC